MTEPKVVRYDFRGNLADPREGVFVHLNDYEALAARVESMQKRIDWLTKREKELEARVQELEDDVREGVEAQVRYVAEITRLREALVGIGAAAMRWKMRAGEVGDKVRSRESIQHTINLVDAALKEKP